MSGSIYGLEFLLVGWLIDNVNVRIQKGLFNSVVIALLKMICQ